MGRETAFRHSASASGAVDHAALERMAAVLEHEAARIASRWVERLEAVLYPARTDLNLEDIRDRAPTLVLGVAKALRRGEAEAADAAWMAAARHHAWLRLEQGISLCDLTREYRALRQEMYNALLPELSTLTVQEALQWGGNLDGAVYTLASIAGEAFEAELRRTNDRLCVYRR